MRRADRLPRVPAQERKAAGLPLVHDIEVLRRDVPMNDDAQELNQLLRHAPTSSYVGLTTRAGAPPLRLAGSDDDVVVTADPHIVRGID